MLEIYKKLRPGEPPTLESAENLFNNMMFDDRRYDLSKVGRYKFNKKLSLANRANGKVLSRPAINEETGEILYDEGTKITKDIADEIQDNGINVIYVTEAGKEYKIIGNSTVDMDKYTGKKLMADSKIKERVYLPVLKELMEEAGGKDAELKKLIKKNVKKLVPKNITIDDILSTISYQLNLEYNVGKIDDIDHLGNRRIKCVGELLQNQFRIGLTRMEKVVRERMNLQNVDMITPQVLMNTRPVISAIKEFFGTSQLSQFMQQDNPLDELTHKRKLSALGPGGLSRERAGFEVRDIHYTHYGRLCPIESPEGPNIGLINYLTSYAPITNKDGKVVAYAFVGVDMDSANGVILSTLLGYTPILAIVIIVLFAGLLWLVINVINKKLISRITEVTETLARTTQAVDKFAQSISNSGAAFAQDSQEQAGSIEEVSASIEETTSMIAQTSEGSTETSKLTLKAVGA